jgi:26 proteasome complex subunit DSS1
MSGAAQADANNTKGVVSDRKDDSQPLAPQKQAAQLEEDDEFEDFPVEGVLKLPPSSSQEETWNWSLRQTDWPAEEELASSGAGAGTTHLWEESWDDDDTSDEFSVQLQYVALLCDYVHPNRILTIQPGKSSARWRSAVKPIPDHETKAVNPFLIFIASKSDSNWGFDTETAWHGVSEYWIHIIIEKRAEKGIYKQTKLIPQTYSW